MKPPSVGSKPNSLRALLAGLSILIAGGWLVGCGRPEAANASPTIATTTSYLEAAVHDLLGPDLRILRLAEPGTCPGHFDIRPSQVTELRRCRVLLRFDFQKSLDAKLAGSNTGEPAVAEVSLHGGMGRPESYLDACRQAADHLVRLGLMARPGADTRLQAIAIRLELWSQNATHRLAQTGLPGTPVIASAHQRDFCEWLGLKVVAVFRPADTASIREIEEALAAGQLAHVQRVIANLPEGRRTADALAARLGSRVIVFENFPALRDGRISYDDMVSANLEALLRSVTP